jgi:uncharacterized SAM-binding protein YcdF (DUF218 family)
MWNPVKVLVRGVLVVLGAIALTLVLLAFTRIPFDAHRWLGTAGGICISVPKTIVLLGGSGMPSGPELMRCNMAAQLCSQNVSANVILLLPQDTALAQDMTAELVQKGVPRNRIYWLLHGRNTREQALDLAQAAPNLVTNPITLVSAPENMYRSLLTFRKAGFKEVCGSPTFEHALFDDLRYDHGRIGGNGYIPDVSRSLNLRYNFWNYLKLEITCIREYVALAYYRLNGWI